MCSPSLVRVVACRILRLLYVVCLEGMVLCNAIRCGGIVGSGAAILLSGLPCCARVHGKAPMDLHMD